MRKIIFVLFCVFSILTAGISFAAFVDNGNGTVTDTTTGLMWQQATGNNGVAMTWKAALAYCASLPLAGHADWRLPNIKELASLVDLSRYNPAIDPKFPDTKSSYYWSSSTYAGYTYGAWGVYFSRGYGNGDDKSYAYYVRAVRGGQSGSFGNLEPQYISGTISPNPGAYGSKFTFESVWQDPDNDSVVDVKAHYRKQGAADWTELPDTLDFVLNTNPPKFTKTVKINGADGTYEYQFQASDSNPAAGPRKHTTAWQGGGTFVIGTATPLPAVKIQVGPSEIPQGFSATIYGESFIPNSTAVLHFRKSDGTEYASVNRTTDANGRILSYYTVSLSMPPDTYTCVATDTSTGRNSNTVSFLVRLQSDPQIQMPMGTSGKPGDSFVLQGTGFTPDGNAELHLRSPNGVEGVLMTAFVTWEGKFVESYKSSYSDAPGAYSWWAVDKSSGKTSAILSFVLVSDTNSGGGFVITTNGNQQAVNVPFTIEVRAVNSSGTTNTMFSNDVSLSGTGIGNISLSKVTLKNGQASASLKVYSPAKGMKLIANGYGLQGESNLFDVTGDATNTGSISGKVINLKGLTTEENALVFLNGSGVSLKQMTDTMGRFRFEGLPPGKYTLSARATDERESRLIDISLTNQPFPRDIYLGSNGNPEGLTPIILIPGIMGSSTTSWGVIYPILPKESPFWKEQWYTGTFGLFDPAGACGWGKLINTLTDPNGEYRYEIGTTLFPVPYDWRIDIDKAANDYLKNWITEAKKRAGGKQKVHVIAHSMGGLVTRSYIQGESYANDIDRFAMVGTPNHGSGMVYYMVEGADPQTADRVSTINSDTFADKGLTWLFHFYEGVSDIQLSIRHLLATPLLLTSADRYAFRSLFVDIPSTRQLMPTYNFLKLTGAYKDSQLLNKSNYWLTDLNESWGIKGANLNRMGLENDTQGKIKTKIFAGNNFDTVQDIEVGVSNINKDFYQDGEPLSLLSYTKGKGDGTVLRDSAYLGNFVSFTDTKPESHAALVKAYMPDVLQFITGKAPQTRTTRDNSSTPTNELNISVFGRAVPFVYDPYGKKCGINPDTDKREDDMSGCKLSMNGSGINLGIRNPVSGTYTLYLKNNHAEDFRLMMSYADSQKAANQDYQWFDNAGVISLTFTINTTSENRLVVNQTISAPTGLQANPFDSGGLKTRLSWSAVSGAASYNVYSKEDDETYLAKLGNTAATSYDTVHSWASDSSVKKRIYAVSAVKSDGTESFLSDAALNNDRDHDGLTDEKEAALGTNPNNPDSDGDGLKDGEEYIYNTNPLLADTDGDGLSDYQEIMGGSDPLDKNSKPVQEDMNGDGKVDLADAILALRVLSGINPQNFYVGNTLSGKAGLQDVVFVLQKVAGLRN